MFQSQTVNKLNKNDFDLRFEPIQNVLPKVLVCFQKYRANDTPQINKAVSANGERMTKSWRLHTNIFAFRETILWWRSDNNDSRWFKSHCWPRSIFINPGNGSFKIQRLTQSSFWNLYLKRYLPHIRSKRFCSLRGRNLTNLLLREHVFEKRNQSLNL